MILCAAPQRAAPSFPPTKGAFSLNSVADVWQVVLERLRAGGLAETAISTWFDEVEAVAIRDMTFYLCCPNDFKRGTIESLFLPNLKAALKEIFSADFDVKLLSAAERDAFGQEKPKKPTSLLESGEFTFDTFVVGNNNRFAHSASLAVAESPGEAYNPLYIYGGPGLGKTHLMHSIGHFILNEKPDTKVIYVTSEEFTNEVIESIRNGNASSMTKFRDKYRKVDVLMIDDIQFIIGKESTQEEFFHTFNALQTQGKQIILTSDKPPKEMETLEERIRSRFEWGLMADIGVPDYETRMAILRKKAESDSLSIDDDILSYIAANIKSNVRELEGALNKLLAYNNLVHMPITMEVAEKELANIITPDKPREITPQLIIEVVSEHFHISVDQMISKTRSNDIAKPRQIAMYLCKTMTDSNLDNIGSLLGGRDHSTIIHGVKKISEEYENNSNTRTLIETIKKKINPN